MVDSSVVESTQKPHDSGSTSLRAAHATAWSFVYVFFTNGIPFDSPNRSEPCPLT